MLVKLICVTCKIHSWQSHRNIWQDVNMHVVAARGHATSATFFNQGLLIVEESSCISSKK